MDALIDKITQCRVCAKFMEHEPRPVLSIDPKSKILIVGQAPGAAVHRTGIPWNDKSGENLRKWLDIRNADFYNPEIFGIVPMGFCYPGKGKSGDLPPRPECAPLWHEQITSQMQSLKLVLLIGKYAQDYYLQKRAKRTLTETVQNFEDYLPQYFVLPHPSPRNNIWQAKNPWFADLVLPELRRSIRSALLL